MVRQDDEAPVQVEYVSTHDEMAADPAFADFSGVFERFQSAEELLNPVAEDSTEAKAKPAADADADGAAEEGEEKMSRKKSRKLKRLSVAELKQLAMAAGGLGAPLLGMKGGVLRKLSSGGSGPVLASGANVSLHPLPTRLDPSSLDESREATRGALPSR